jgi:hypothetical protein
MRNRRLLALLGAAAVALALAAPAAANTSQISLMQDDDLLLYRGPEVQQSTLQRMLALGVDTVRINLIWRNVVGKGGKKVKRKPTNPRSYPVANWDPYDGVVRQAAALGMGVYVTVTGPAPAFAEGPKPPSRSEAPVWKPNAKMYGQFVEAVGRRYSGGYADENDSTPLPAVTTWSLWNEPNQAGWLEPQWDHRRATSPKLYRSLFFAADRALRKTGHGGDQVYLGETAPLGSKARSRKAPMGPKTFLAALFRGGKRFPVTGYAHHPYTKKNPPNVPDRSPGAITIANIGDLESILDGSGNVSAGLPILSTEFGYESNPPDPFTGIPQETQADWIDQGEAMMYNDPRITGNTQFLLRDAPPNSRFSPSSRRYWFTYQSGLYNADDTPKPAAQAYAMPLVATPLGTNPDGTTALSIWGQLRFRANNAPPTEVQLQFRPQGSTDWTNTGPPIGVTDPLGFYQGQVAIPFAGVVRAVWTSTTEYPFTLSSREAVVSF